MKTSFNVHLTFYDVERQFIKELSDTMTTLCNRFDDCAGCPFNGHVAECGEFNDALSEIYRATADNNVLEDCVS